MVIVNKKKIRAWKTKPFYIDILNINYLTIESPVGPTEQDHQP